jgi:hypothetical protein
VNFPVSAEEDVDENTPDNEDDSEEFEPKGGGEWTNSQRDLAMLVSFRGARLAIRWIDI